MAYLEFRARPNSLYLSDVQYGIAAYSETASPPHLLSHPPSLIWFKHLRFLTHQPRKRIHPSTHSSLRRPLPTFFLPQFFLFYIYSFSSSLVLHYCCAACSLLPFTRKLQLPSFDIISSRGQNPIHNRLSLNYFLCIWSLLHTRRLSPHTRVALVSASPVRPSCPYLRDYRL